MENIDKKELEPIDEASNKDAVILKTAILIASNLLNEDNQVKKINLTAALAILAIAGTSGDQEAIRLVNIARKLYKE